MSKCLSIITGLTESGDYITTHDQWYDPLITEQRIIHWTTPLELVEYLCGWGSSPFMVVYELMSCKPNVVETLKLPLRSRDSQGRVQGTQEEVLTVFNALYNSLPPTHMHKKYGEIECV